VDDVEHDALRGHRGARRPEMEVHFPAVAAFKLARDGAFIGQSAAFAKGRPDGPHTLPAPDPDIAFVRSRGFHAANLADRKVEKPQPGFKPAFQPA